MVSFITARETSVTTRFVHLSLVISHLILNSQLSNHIRAIHLGLPHPPIASLIRFPPRHKIKRHFWP